MKVCDEVTEKKLTLKELSPGDVFRWKKYSDMDIKIRLCDGWVTLNRDYNYSTSLDDSEVIVYPDACIQLGKPGSEE